MIGLLITGASRGFGRSTALAFAKRITSHSIHFILTARSSSDLDATVQLIKEARGEVDAGISAGDRIDIIVADLSDLSTLEDSSKRLFDSLEGHGEYYRVFFVNNAGSMGPLETIGALQHCGLNEMKALFDFNITSSSFLTSVCVQRLKAKTFQYNSADIIHVSSLCAIQAFPSWGTYCTGKAARDMFHNVVAAELTAEKIENIKTLNYAPGPLDTDMQKHIREEPRSDLATRQIFITMKEEGQLIDPEVSADKLYTVLEGNTYASGSHVDFYDI